jgi:hypothetical protein
MPERDVLTPVTVWVGPMYVGWYGEKEVRAGYHRHGRFDAWLFSGKGLSRQYRNGMCWRCKPADVAWISQELERQATLARQTARIHESSEWQAQHPRCEVSGRYVEYCPDHADHAERLP